MMRSVLRPAAIVIVLFVAVLLIASRSISLEAGAAQPGAYWTCPMDKDVVASNPGRCPKCGMALVKVNADGTPARISPAKPPTAKTPAVQKAAAAKAAKAAGAAVARPGSATLALHTDPQPLQVGATDFMVMVKDANHELVADATVTLVMTLPPVPGGQATRIEIPMKAAEYGIYRGSGRIPKIGSWTFMVEAKRGTFRLGTLTDTRVTER